MNQFSFFRSYFEATSMLEDADRLEFYDAIFQFMFDEKEPNFTGIKQMAWTLIKPNLNTSKARSKAGSTEQKESKEIKTNQNESNGISHILGEGEGEGEGKGEEKKKDKRACALPKNFILSGSLIQYARDRKLNHETMLEEFKDHHLAKGSKMKDWNAAFRTWCRNAVKFSAGRKKTSGDDFPVEVLYDSPRA